MKTQFRLSILTVAFMTMMSNTACTKSSSSDGGGGGDAAAASTLTLQSVSVATGSTTNLVPTGGTPPYSFTLQSSIGGTLQSYTTYSALTAGNTAGMVGVTVTDSVNQSAMATITVTAAAGSLIVTPLTASVAPSGTVAYVVSGGTGTYSYSATAGTFSGATFTAPSTAQTVTVTISDTGGHTVTATVIVSGTSLSNATCDGVYDLNLSGYPGTLTVVQNTAGHIGGSLALTGYGYAAAIDGTCTAAGVIHFTDLYSQAVYTGTYFINSVTQKNFMYGTYTDPVYGGPYSWSASAK
ncbi:MAG: hypothetical protein ACXVA9_03820 [Bdellovibrionales bacterium]